MNLQQEVESLNEKYSAGIQAFMEEMEQLKAWEALQNVPSYVERIQGNPELFEQENKQEARQEHIAH